MSKIVQIALVKGDGSAPEMMAQATEIAIEAARRDNIAIKFVETPMGWNAYGKYGDTLPAPSFNRASDIGTLFFGGVGDPEKDNTIGEKKPEMRPETRCLLTIRSQWGLLLNFRPMIYHYSLRHLALVKEENIPPGGIEQHFIRFLLQDSYFGTADLIGRMDKETIKRIGLKRKSEVTGLEEIVSEVAYYRRETIVKYMRAAFAYARQKKLPLISIDKANVMARYQFWRIIAAEIGKTEFPDVELRHQYVDSANALLFTPAKLHGVIVCGNEHGDILSDGAAAALGSMGMMCSSAINPDTGQAMFESGAGTAPTLVGQDIANPIGRILTAAMMLEHIGAVNGSAVIEAAVKKVLEAGWRTKDLAVSGEPKLKILGTIAMGGKIKEALN